MFDFRKIGEIGTKGRRGHSSSVVFHRPLHKKRPHKK
jgi:hypothetical protein